MQKPAPSASSSMAGRARGSPAPGPACRPPPPCPLSRPPPALRGSDVTPFLVATFHCRRGLARVAFSLNCLTLGRRRELCAPRSGEPLLHGCSPPPPRGLEGSPGALAGWLNAWWTLHSTPRLGLRAVRGIFPTPGNGTPPAPIGAASSLTAEQAPLTYPGPAQPHS